MNRLTFSDETKELLNVVVDALPPQEREVVFRIYYDGVSHRQVGREMNLSARQVGRIERRVLERLRELVAKLEDVQ